MLAGAGGAICAVPRPASDSDEPAARLMVVELPASNGAGRAKAVLLPRMPAYGNAPGLLARPGSVEDGLELRCATGNETLNLRPLQRIEGNGNNEFHLLQATPAAH